MTLSGYRLMWIMVMIDLPVLTREERKAATDFRNALLDLGFEMTQFSVYLRFCMGASHGDTLTSRVEAALPTGGKVNVLFFTDKQYERILTFHGRRPGPAKLPPDQYALF